MAKTLTDIDSEATTLLENVFGSIDAVRYPVNLDEIIEYCGLSVKQGLFSNPEMEGALDRRNKTIYLSENDDVSRQNFTAAHELGHYKLHASKSIDVFTMYDLKNIITRQQAGGDEAEADRFAASLLMPEKPVKSIWSVTRNIDKMSKIFGVPKVVVRYRLRSLKLL